MRVSVVTDTTSYLPGPLLQALDVPAVGLHVLRDGRDDREDELDDLDGFYADVGAGRIQPTTSQPSVGELLEAYEPALAAGRDVVSVHIAGGISGTVAAAQQAAEEAARSHPDRRVLVLDSQTACGGLGGVVLAARAAAERGLDADAVLAHAEEAARQVSIWFAVDTLDHLKRGGRVSPTAAWVGGALRIKPILTVRGTIEPIERVRTSRRAFERMVRFLEELREGGSDAWMIQHIRSPADASRLVERGREIFGTEPIVVSEIGPVIGTHVGPGLLGVGGLPGALLEGLPRTR